MITRYSATVEGYKVNYYQTHGKYKNWRISDITRPDGTQVPGQNEISPFEYIGMNYFGTREEVQKINIMQGGNGHKEIEKVVRLIADWENLAPETRSQIEDVLAQYKTDLILNPPSRTEVLRRIENGENLFPYRR